METEVRVALETYVKKIAGDDPNDRLSPSKLSDRYSRRHGSDSPNARMLGNVVQLLTRSGEYDSGIFFSDLKFTDDEASALVRASTGDPTGTTTLHLAFFGSPQVKKHAIEQIPMLHKDLVLDVCLGFLQTKDAKLLSEKSAKATLRSLLKVASSSTKTLTNASFPLAKVLEANRFLHLEGLSGLADQLLTTFLSSKRIQKGNELPLAESEELISSTLLVLLGQKATRRTSRGILLSLSPHLGSEFADRRYWEDCSFKDLVTLSSFDAVRQTLSKPPLSDLLTERLLESADSMRLMDLVNELHRFRGIPVDPFSEILKKKLQAKSHTASLINRIMEVSIGQQVDELVAEETKNLIDRSKAAEALTERLTKELSESKKVIEASEEKILELRKAQIDIGDDQRIQARLDLIHSFIDVVERFRDWSEHDSISGVNLREMLSYADVKLRDLGVDIVGIPGKPHHSDHSLFDFKITKQSDSFVVVSPAYRLGSDPACVFRRGLA